MSNNDFYRRRSEQKKKQRQAEIKFFLAISVAILAIALIVVIVLIVKNHRGNTERDVDHSAEYENLYIADQPEIQVMLLTPNKYSRSQKALEEVNSIVIHWTANPGTTAEQNRDYFEGLKDSHQTSASAHFIVGLDGEIVQCIPCNEVAYASNDRNYDSISIECCTPDETGEFNGNTYDSAVELTAWLVGRYQLTVDDIIRHYDITGKDCPKYFVENEDAWEQFKKDVENYIIENGVSRDLEVSTEFWPN